MKYKRNLKNILGIQFGEEAQLNILYNFQRLNLGRILSYILCKKLEKILSKFHILLAHKLYTICG